MGWCRHRARTVACAADPACRQLRAAHAQRCSRAWLSAHSVRRMQNTRAVPLPPPPPSAPAPRTCSPGILVTVRRGRSTRTARSAVKFPSPACSRAPRNTTVASSTFQPGESAEPVCGVRRLGACRAAAASAGLPTPRPSRSARHACRCAGSSDPRTVAEVGAGREHDALRNPFEQHLCAKDGQEGLVGCQQCAAHA